MRKSRGVALLALFLLLGLIPAGQASADSKPTLIIGDLSVKEGDTGTTLAVFPISLTSPSPNIVTADYHTADGQASAPSDYTAESGQVTFQPGNTLVTVGIRVKGDLRNEGDEDFYLEIDSAFRAETPERDGDAIIVDDDPLPYLSVGSPTLTEGNSGQKNAVFPITLSQASGLPVRAKYETLDDEATAGEDYAYTAGTITLDPGQISTTVNVPVYGDTINEGPWEAFYLDLSKMVNADSFREDGYATIRDDDGGTPSKPILTVGDSFVAEPTSGTANEVFDVNLSSAESSAVSVDYSTHNGSATAGTDYVTTDGTLTFQPGETDKTIEVPVNANTNATGDQNFWLVLDSSTNNADIGDDDEGDAIIQDDDHAPYIAVSNTGLHEGNTGTTPATFRVSLSEPSPNTITAQYATFDGSATGGSASCATCDYVSKSGSLTFQPGQTSKQVSVPVNGDTIDEDNEDLGFSLTDWSDNAQVYSTQRYGWAVIYDDDTQPWASVRGTSVVEGASGTTTNCSFVVYLTHPSANTITVKYSTDDSTAHAPSDYTSKSGTLTFNPGVTQETVNVQVKGDDLIEEDEQFYLSLDSATNATVNDYAQRCMIFDDDAGPRLFVTSTAAKEGSAGSPGTEAFVVQLEPPSPTAVTVHYKTVGHSAVAGTDFVAKSGTLTFSPGTTSQTVNVSLVGDSTKESNKYFSLDLSNPVQADIEESSADATILNDDNVTPPSPVYAEVTDAAVVEGNSGTVQDVFTVRLSPAPPSTVNVSYETTDGDARAPYDYTAKSGTLSFSAGQTSKTVSVTVKGDTINEGDELFHLELTDVTGYGGADIDDGLGLGYIVNDDHSPTIGVDDTSVIEPDTGTAKASFKVSLSNASPQPVYVDWATDDGTAVAPSDYTDDSGTLLFTPGQTSKTVTITVQADTEPERTEYFDLELDHEIGGVTLDGSADSYVRDEDVYSVVGSVQDGSSAPVQGVSMTISGNRLPNRTVKTDANGNFVIPNVPDGDYTLKASKSGLTFTPSSRQVTVQGAPATGLDFTAS